jgi:EmrB/QacA subfamily drug resistance transporter
VTAQATVARAPAGAGRPPAAPLAPPVPGNYKWIAATVVMVGMLMSILDQTVVNVALNSLQNDFRVTVTDIQWVVTGYTLGLAAVIPTSGWLSDRFGSRRVFIISEIAFTATSALCGLAISANMLIAVRVLQGVAGGLLMPVGMAILMSTSRPEERGRMMAVLGVPTMLAPILGPTLGGWLIQAVSWRLIFYINVPIGIAGAVLSLLLLRGQAGRRDVERLDWGGLLLASPGVVGIVYGLAQPATYGWGSVQTLGPLLGGAVLLAVFCLYELRQPHPLIQIRIFRDPAFTAAMLTSVVVVVALFGVALLMPLFLQQVQGYGALDAGLIVASQGVGALITMPISGVLTDRVGAARIVPVGIALLFAATVWATTLQVDTSRTTIMLMLGLRGMGMGFCMMPVFSAAYVTLRPELIARATSVANTIQRVGSALGFAVMTTILSSRIAANLPRLPGGGASLGTSGSLSGAHLPASIKTLLLQQVTKGYQDTFWIAAGIVLLGFPMAVLLRRARRPEEVHAYGLRQLRHGIVLGAAALWVERNPGALDGRWRRLPVGPGPAFQALARAAQERLRTGITILHMGTNAAGLLPNQPLPAWRRGLALLALAAAVVGLAFCFAHGLQTSTPPALPALRPPVG